MQKASIKVNYVLNTLYQVLTLITPLITAPYVSRVLGPEGVGTYSYTTSVVAFFTLFAVLGTTTYGQRAIAQCRDDRGALSRCFWEIELLSVLTTFVCVVLWLVYALSSTVYRLYFIILTIDLVAVALDIIWFYSGLEQFGLIVLRNATIKLLSIVLLFALVKSRDDVWLYIAIQSLGKILGNASMWLPLSRYVDRVPIRSLSVRTHLKETLAYFIPTAAASVYTYLDKVMIGNFTVTNVENGYYEQANRIVNMAYTVLISLNTVMSARMSYLFALGKLDEVRMRLERALAFILTLGIPLAFGMAGVSSNFVGWFFGPDFDKVRLLMVLASPLIPIMAVHNYLSAQYLVPSGQRVRSTKGVIVGSMVNLMLNLVLIPRLQSVGAEIATVVSEIAICAVYFHMSKDYIPVSMFIRHAVKPLAAGFVMYILVIAVGAISAVSPITTAIQLVVGMASYGLVMLLMRDSFAIEYIYNTILKLNKFRPNI